ncbi:MULTISPECIES: hypothetical protein [unclassified Nonomuraea]|uniref:hypothetical protein n=1 Tax=unclassified Nonomuraea TaxID=2593643 RepID=UPI00340FFF60
MPEPLRPYVDWVTGTAWPKGEAEGCFRMADACVVAAHRIVAGTAAADPFTAELLGDRWDGAAQEAFVGHVREKVGGRQAELVKRLVDAAIALNGVGVAIQHAERLITLVVLFLLAVLPVVIWRAPWLLRPVLQVTRMTVLQIARYTAILIAVFAAFGTALDLGAQYSEIVAGGRRDGVDWDQLATTARDGAINGLLTGLLGGGLGRLATPALRAGVSRAEAALGEKVLTCLTGTLPGQAIQYGVTGAATTAISLSLDGRPLDWELILKSGVAAGLGADGQHLTAPRLRPQSAAPEPARLSGAEGAAYDRARVPFAFEDFFTDPRWAADSERFELRLGAHYFNDPQTLEAARTGVRRMRDVLTALTLRAPDESPAQHTRRVEQAFFRDDAPDSAGQVGTRVTLDHLLARGNVRELMTAFYNAAYFNDGHPHTLSNTLLHVLDTERQERARLAGVDLDLLERARQQLDGNRHRAVLGKVDEWVMGGSRFARDPLETGNVIMMSDRSVRDLAEVVQSQVHRRDRTLEEQQRNGFITTPAHYENRGTPLGRFERSYIESVGGGPLHADTPLPWREGRTAHQNTTGRWARLTAGDGHSVIDGISVTTTKMMAAAGFLGLDKVTTERFLGGLMGWMLPCRDHSLFEIMRGAQLAGLEHLAPWPAAHASAVDVYRHLPGMDLRTLRAGFLRDGLFPHEAMYLRHATDPGGFAETQFEDVRDIARRLGEQLAGGRVTDPTLTGWLRRNGVDPLDPAAVRAMGERLSPGHMMALTVYTRPSHDLINNVTRTQLWTAGMSETAVRKVLNVKVERRLAGYLGELAEGVKGRALSFPLRPLLHAGDGPLTPQSPLTPAARVWVDAAQAIDQAKCEREEHRAAGRKAEARQAEDRIREARREQRSAWREIREDLGGVLPRLATEMRWHADMAHDALMQLPPVGSPDQPVLAFRGDWLTPVHSPIYGSRRFPHGMTREFLSLSRSLEVAVQYVSKNLVGDRGVLVVYALTGRNGRDISIFSTHPEQEEILLPPRSPGRRRHDPELEARIRAALERTAEDMIERGKLDKVPDSYDILIMDEE